MSYNNLKLPTSGALQNCPRNNQFAGVARVAGQGIGSKFLSLIVHSKRAVEYPGFQRLFSRYEKSESRSGEKNVFLAAS